MNSMVDKNLQMSYLIVDDMHNAHPELLKDQYWDESFNKMPDRYEDGDDSDETTDIVDFDVVQRSSNIFRRRSTSVAFKPKTKDAEAGRVSDD